MTVLVRDCVVDRSSTVQGVTPSQTLRSSVFLMGLHWIIFTVLLLLLLFPVSYLGSLVARVKVSE